MAESEIAVAGRSVVNIAVQGSRAARINPFLSDSFFKRFLTPSAIEPMSAGSGVIFDALNGYIVTNRHIIQAAEEITVTLLDQRVFLARLIGADSVTNLAVLQIQADNLVALDWIAPDTLTLGAQVWALGNPFGQGLTVTHGIISGTSHIKLFTPKLAQYIHTTTAIHPGNSGGALIDLQGRLIGINTDRVLPQRAADFGFAISSTIAQSVIRQLIEYGDTQPGVVGVSVQELTYDLIEAFEVPLRQGVIVTEVKGPQGDLEVGDILVAFNGTPIANVDHFQSLVRVARQGSEVEVVYYRERQAQTTVLRIEPIPEVVIEGEALHPKLSGSVFSAIPKERVQYRNVQGIYVKAVLPGSSAWNNHLRQGDIILNLNRWRIRSLEVFERLMPRVTGRFILYLLRDSRRLRILVQ